MAGFIHFAVLCGYTLAAVGAGSALAQLRPEAGPELPLLAGAIVFLVGAVLHGLVARRRSDARTLRRLLALKKAHDALRAELAAAQEDIARLHDAVERAAEAAQPVTETLYPASMYVPPMEGDSPEAAEMQGVAAEVRVLHSLLEKLYSDAAPAASRAREGRPDDERHEPSLTARGGARGGLHVVGDAEGASRILDIVRDGLRQDRVDLYLQPIVSLPQRKRRFFECFSRIRAEDGGVIAPDQYIEVAREAGLLPAVDNMLLFRCIQLLRKLQQRDYAAEFFCNVSANTLADREFLRDFIDYMESHVELAGSLVLEITQRDFEEHLPAIEADLVKLGGLGYRFSLDGVRHFGLDVPALAERHFHFVKIDAAMLLERVQAGGAADVRALKQQLDEHGVDLVIERIESEQMLVELLDFNIDYGQGYLFGEPRISKDPTASDRAGQG